MQKQNLFSDTLYGCENSNNNSLDKLGIYKFI